MPIYEYECGNCGHRLDALQKISEQPLRTCPACSADSLRKLISAPQFRLSGSGWYETDFKKDKRRNLAESGDKPGAADKPAKGADKQDGGKAASAAGSSGANGKAAPKTGSRSAGSDG